MGFLKKSAKHTGKRASDFTRFVLFLLHSPCTFIATYCVTTSANTSAIIAAATTTTSFVIRLLHSYTVCYTTFVIRLLHSYTVCYTTFVIRLLHSYTVCYTTFVIRLLHSYTVCYTIPPIIPVRIMHHHRSEYSIAYFPLLLPIL
jgi:hypothetical protein